MSVKEHCDILRRTIVPGGVDTRIYIPSVMEDDTPTKDTAVARPRLYGIVQTYIQKKLPRNIHPAFKALRDCEESAVTSPQTAYTGEATLSLPVTQEHTSENDRAGGTKGEVDGNYLPL